MAKSEIGYRSDRAAHQGEPQNVTTPHPTDNPSPLRSTETPAAEWRHLTILLCDLVGSTEYADRLDPEDFRRLMESFCRLCSAVIERHKGVTASYIGDAIQAYFGHPRASSSNNEIGQASISFG
ncbi:hypothetical protein EH240_13145 [Mesorhizobium tamadayense]|uniref:Guanylate cyclase domain-containing protein n=1 Tax=Mesorhizobium tamadayense TaxID=425306 RepID=A0A3P3FU39_9HYPH|nr:adenylate/guanylate cyclase domain-containing protein [Mesorhizobium tamadayense]RRI01977.1 hypothetical protein EH240_13145 [Mesorhizobium tamadayense]